MRVFDVRHIHAPQLRPAPWALEEDFRNRPQRVTAFHGVTVGCIGR